MSASDTDPKPDPKSAASRQAAYRQRRARDQDQHRLNLWVGSPAYFALRRLARLHRVSQQQIIEQLVTGADDAVLATLDLDTPEWDHYFSVTR